MEDDASVAVNASTLLKSARYIYERNLLGLKDRAKSTDFQIALLKDRLPRCDGDDANVAVNASTLLKGARYEYEYYFKKFGLTSEGTLQSSLRYVTKLVKAHRGIEAERLIVKLAASSRRVHGAEHRFWNSSLLCNLKIIMHITIKSII